MKKLGFIIRRVTIPPVFAVALLTVLYICNPSFFKGAFSLAMGIVFLAVLPTLAYPLQKYVPHFKDKGREGQRTLAMIFSFVGYVSGVALAYALSVPKELKLLFLEYLLCGILMLVFNKLLKIRASGHSCGIVGPVLLFIYFGLYIPAIIGSALIIIVYITSVITKRHTISELIFGSLIPAAVLTALHFIM